MLPLLVDIPSIDELIAEMKRELRESAAVKSNQYNFDFLLDLPTSEGRRFSWTTDHEGIILGEEKLRRRKNCFVEIGDGGVFGIATYNN
ncbi:unnamed protein product [Blepharisma stoltei]|uniref:Cyclin-dependent kinase inhibitor domain-containing protein n=1 Tax=Blepharisma stoltei TaxID=1481888 RepID=A0AAU9JXF0_9CILI|nr:unnamed protein product [Blepharisma stoltei]